MATITIDTGGETPSQATEPATPDPDETARFQIQTIIEFLQVKPRSDFSPGAQEALNWAQSSACDAARRIFEGMNVKGAES